MDTSHERRNERARAPPSHDVAARVDRAGLGKPRSLGHAATLLEPVDAALGADSEEGVRRAAHGLRAALLMVGALPAAELAAEVERVTLEQARGLRAGLAFELARATADLEVTVGAHLPARP